VTANWQGIKLDPKLPLLMLARKIKTLRKGYTGSNCNNMALLYFNSSNFYLDKK